MFGLGDVYIEFCRISIISRNIRGKITGGRKNGEVIWREQVIFEYIDFKISFGSIYFGQFGKNYCGKNSK